MSLKKKEDPIEETLSKKKVTKVYPAPKGSPRYTMDQIFRTSNMKADLLLHPATQAPAHYQDTIIEEDGTERKVQRRKQLDHPDKPRKVPKVRTQKSNEFTPERKEGFLIALQMAAGSIILACKVLHISQTTIKKYLKIDPAFKEEVERVKEEVEDRLEHALYERALNGVTKGVYHKGELIAEETVYPENVAMFLLKAMKPEKYADRSAIAHSLTAASTFSELVEQVGKDPLIEDDSIIDIKGKMEKQDESQ